MVENLKDEIWKDIESYEGLYQISNFGRVKSLSRLRINGKGSYWTKEKLHAITDNGSGYKICTLTPMEGKEHKKNYYIHRLVAKAFIPNTMALPEVNHKDYCLSNNHVGNLEWCDRKYNCNYGEHNIRLSRSLKEKYKSGEIKAWNKGKKHTEEARKKISEAKKNKGTIKVICLNDDNIFDSIKNCGTYYNIFANSISAVCKGKYKQYKGYRFMYYEDWLTQQVS